MYIQKDTIVFSGDDTIICDLNRENFIQEECVRLKLDTTTQLILNSRNYVQLSDESFKSVDHLTKGDNLLYHKARPNTFGYTDTADSWNIIAISLLNLENNKFAFSNKELDNKFNELSNKIYPSIKKEYDGEFKDILENNYNNITDIFKSSLNDRIEFCSIFEENRTKIRKSIDKNVLVNIFYSIGKDVAIVDHGDFYMLVKLNLDGYESIPTTVLSVEHYEDNCFNIYPNDVIINGIRVVTSPIK